MAEVSLKSLSQTERNGLFSLVFEGEALSEFEKFVERFKSEADAVRDLNVILAAIDRMMQGAGFLERYFRPEGKMNDGVCALPIESGKLRLYCLRLSDSVLIAGNGGRKTTRTYNESAELSGYVISLQNLDRIIKTEVKKGNIIIESGIIEGIEGTTFEL
ncbi:MAG: hypothetical protein IJ154_00110 [Bacteroidales bacterium]|nr:hypothetical protein [Bacteroidales bacterium]